MSSGSSDVLTIMDELVTFNEVSSQVKSVDSLIFLALCGLRLPETHVENFPGALTTRPDLVSLGVVNLQYYMLKLQVTYNLDAQIKVLLL